VRAPGACESLRGGQFCVPGYPQRLQWREGAGKGGDPGPRGALLRSARRAKCCPGASK